MSLKKLFAYSTLFFISPTILGWGYTIKNAPSIQGFYGGAGINVDHANLNSQWNIVKTNILTNAVDIDALHKSDWSAHAFGGNIFFGYQRFVVDNLYLAFEALGQFNSMGMNFQSDFDQRVFQPEKVTRNLNIHVSRVLSLSILPAYQISNQSLLFMRLGLAQTTFNVKGKSNSVPVDVHNGENRTVFENLTRLSGYQYGLGQQLVLTNNLSARIEYSQSAVKGLNEQYISPVNVDDIRQKNAINITSPKIETMQFSLIYHFNDLVQENNKLLSKPSKGFDIYIGVSGGRPLANIQQYESSLTVPRLNPALPTRIESERHDLSATGSSASILIGGGINTLDRLYFGSELFFETLSLNGGHQINQYTYTPNTGTEQYFFAEIRDEMKSSIGVSFISGYLLSNHSKIYARFGIVQSRFKIYEGGGSAPSIELDDQFNSENYKNLLGAQFGFGLEGELDGNLGLRTEISINKYKQFTIPKTTAGSTNFHATRYFKIKPFIKQFNIALVYHFK